MNYNLFYYIGCNDIKVNSFLFNKKNLAHKTFFYQNSHGDNFFNFADYFFPSYSFLEKQSGYYINCFGILKKNRQLVLPRNEFVQDDKDIVKLVHKMVFDINFNSNLSACSFICSIAPDLNVSPATITEEILFSFNR